jgi:hypothetical protein
MCDLLQKCKAFFQYAWFFVVIVVLPSGGHSTKLQNQKCNIVEMKVTVGNTDLTDLKTYYLFKF